jgi:hypothetical protein
MIPVHQLQCASPISEYNFRESRVGGGETRLRYTLTMKTLAPTGGPDRSPRQGWEEAFRALAESGDDGVLLGKITNAFDGDEWTW